MHDTRRWSQEVNDISCFDVGPDKSHDTYCEKERISLLNTRVQRTITHSRPLFGDIFHRH